MEDPQRGPNNTLTNLASPIYAALCNSVNPPKTFSGDKIGTNKIEASNNPPLDKGIDSVGQYSFQSEGASAAEPHHPFIALVLGDDDKEEEKEDEATLLLAPLREECGWR